ncbi:MAG: hypothetical protein LW832_03795 [Parachlamydia sp.]|jgi:hypothetical protein|nr:hypothetical protein [Parachlamydia sp.]
MVQLVNPFTIEMVDKISHDLQAHMKKDLASYEAEYGVDVNYKRFSLVAHTQDFLLGYRIIIY